MWVHYITPLYLIRVVTVAWMSLNVEHYLIYTCTCKPVNTLFESYKKQKVIIHLEILLILHLNWLRPELIKTYTVLGGLQNSHWSLWITSLWNCGLSDIAFFCLGRNSETFLLWWTHWASIILKVPFCNQSWLQKSGHLLHKIIIVISKQKGLMCSWAKTRHCI